MIKNALLPMMTAAAILASSVAATAATTSMAGGMKGSMHAMAGMEHGMPEGKTGGDGVPYTGSPDLQVAISLVTAGGAPGHFSIVKALTSLVGAKAANAEVEKLTDQYGKAKVASFVAVQNFAVDDAVKKALAAGVKFPAPTMKGAALAAADVKLGLEGGTYYEGVQLDHIVTHDIHEAVMADIDMKFGASADGNYHRIADQAHVDLAHALGAKTVKLPAYH